ncbi:hypothetical protein AB0H88_18860 [Nonomuraea sp. NPDC050680]|uniref:hypothetical protein n=1 Tax=Nonomuraea sp. NPDC050680 TaxID=3154630 RepID=UPI00340F5820
MVHDDGEGLASRLPKLTDAERATVATKWPGLLAELREGPPPAATVGWDAFAWTPTTRSPAGPRR